MYSRSTLVVLILALTRSVSDAGALLTIKRRQPGNVCVNNQSCTNINEGTNMSKGPLPRGGGGSVATATSDSIISNAPISDYVSITNWASVVGTWLNINPAMSTSIRKFWFEAERTKFLFAGAVSGIVSRTAVSPLEVVATLQMVRGGNKNIVAELSELFKSEGVKGFFKGNGANCLKVAPTRGVQFFAYESFKSRLVGWKRQQMGLAADAEVTLSPLERLVTGGFAGMIASSMVYPIEVVKTMLTMYPGKYSGIGAAFKGVVSEVGFKGLYAGLGPTLVAMFPYVGMEFMIYESSKIAVESFLQNRVDDETMDKAKVTIPIIISLALGALAGAAAQSSAHPLDVVRKRLQIQGINGNPVLYKNTIACITGIASKEGFSQLYKGLGPACVATIPGTAIAYITYEFMKTALHLDSV